MMDKNTFNGVALPSTEEVFVSQELGADVCEAMEAFAFEQFKEKRPSREWVEEYLDTVYPVMYGTCWNCSRNDSACRLIHITPGDVEKLVSPKFDLLCDDCFAAARDITTAHACNDMEGLSSAMQRFNVRSEMSLLRAVN